MENATFTILTGISLLSVMLILRRLIEVFPSLLAGVIRWKENVNLEASVRLSRDRDIIAATLILPFCIIVSVKGLYLPEIIAGHAAEGSRIWIILATFTGFVILRAMLESIFRPKKMSKHTYRCAGRAGRTFFIILVLVLLALCGIFSVLNTDIPTQRSAMLWVSAIIYMLFLIRKYQIFISSCSIFVGFLYLCALEILPTGVLVASAVIF